MTKVNPMPREISNRYIRKKDIMPTRGKRLKIIEEAAKVLEEYGEPMTVRQVLYRLISKGIIPNTEYQYGYLSTALVIARVNDVIPYAMIIDETRYSISGCGFTR